MRKSEYIDFDKCTVQLHPMELQTALGSTWTDGDKIKLFECRVDVWIFGCLGQRFSC